MAPTALSVALHLRQRRRRPISHAAVIATSTILFSCSYSEAKIDVQNENHRRAIDISNNPYAAPILQSLSSCADGQVSLQLTLNTDAHSADDNSWRISRLGSVIESGSVTTDDAVVGTTVCLDVSNDHECWDFELHDDFGDGLTAPHSDSGGTPGSFTLYLNDVLVASHTTVPCLLENESGKSNECASKHGFEYCGLRICRVGESVSVSNLQGSQCSIDERQCGSDSSTSLSTSDAFQVHLNTDGYSADISWDLRDTAGNLVLSGGNTDIIGTLAQPGAVEFDNFESFHSSICLPQDECYDFRVYDVYGDGISCGADGSISLSFPGGKSLLQEDENVANLQRLDDGTKTLACMDKKEKSAWHLWSFCHVRVCQDGSVTGLEGNQCSFGDSELVDPNATGFIVGVAMSLNSQAASPDKNEKPCSEGGDCTLAQEFSITEPELMTASFEEKGEDLNWAEYFHLLIGVKDNESSVDKPVGVISPNSQAAASHEEHRLTLETFYVNLLSPDSPYKLKYYRPHQMSIAISTHLLSYLLNDIEGWEDDNAPLHFELDCKKSSQQFDSDQEQVIECNGDAIFPKSSLPKKSAMIDLIHQAFAGEYHVKFLEYMYVDYDPESYTLDESSDLTKKEKKEQKLQDKLQQNSEEANTEKDEKDELRDSLKEDGLSKREWKKEIRNKTEGRHLRIGY
ncbi:hypothetical protein ACHAXN_002946 [Cyclotella atomus]